MCTIFRTTALAIVAVLGMPRVGAAQTAATPAPTQATASSETRRFTYTFGVDYFFQTSARRNYPFTTEEFQDAETFFWERLRPKLTVSSPRMSVVIEGQDTHSRGSAFTVRTAWLDLLNAYVDVRQMGGWSVKVGRRQGDFDTIPRLVRTPDFAAVVRSFDVVEVGWQRQRTDVRALAFRTVDNLPDRFNTWRKGERLWSTYVRQGVGRHALQTYLTTRLNTGVASEDGLLGSGAIYAWETLATGPLPFPRMGYSIEHILERGRASTDQVRASGLFGSITAEPRPGIDMELRYVRTSGDRARGDGIRGGYDAFYMAVAPFSALGLMRGTNVHALSIGATHTLHPKVSWIWRIHDSHATTLQDGWYSVRTIRRPDAGASRIGNELDTLVTVAVSPRLNIRAGFYKFFAGPYLRNTGTSGSPYELRLQIFGRL